MEKSGFAFFLKGLGFFIYLAGLFGGITMANGQATIIIYFLVSAFLLGTIYIALGMVYDKLIEVLLYAKYPKEPDDGNDTE